MAVTPLSRSDLAAVAALIEAGRLDKVPVDERRASAFLVALGRFLRAILGTPPGDKAAQRFDQLRRARNQSHYEAVPIGKAAADQAEAVARALYIAAVDRGLTASRSSG